MKDKDEKILRSIASAVPQMTEFEKGYLLGLAEAKVSEKKNGSKVRANPKGPVAV